MHVCVPRPNLTNHSVVSFTWFDSISPHHLFLYHVVLPQVVSSTKFHSTSFWFSCMPAHSSHISSHTRILTVVHFSCHDDLSHLLFVCLFVAQHLKSLVMRRQNYFTNKNYRYPSFGKYETKNAGKTNISNIWNSLRTDFLCFVVWNRDSLFLVFFLNK